jgi:outer membrane protein TolC
MLSVVLFINTAAQETDTLTLRFSLAQARDYALENSPILHNAIRDVEIAKKFVWESTSIGLPQVNASGAYSYTPKLADFTDFFVGMGGGDSTGGGMPFDIDDLKTTITLDIQLNQLIFSGTYLVGLKAAKVYASLSSMALTKSRADLLQGITDTYFMILASRESKSVLDSTLKTLSKTLSETQQYHKQGFIESTDIDQIKILVSNIKNSLELNKRQIDITERLLKFQMGIPIEKSMELTDQINPLIDKANLEAMEIDSFFYKKNVTYQMVETRENLMALNWQVKKTAYLPSLVGFYNHHEKFDDNPFSFAAPDMVGLSLNIPIFSSGQRMAGVSKARLEYEKARTDKEVMTENLLIQYENARSGFLAARDIYFVQKESRDLARNIYDKTLRKFSLGVSSSLDINQVQQQYFRAESDYYGALIGLVSAKTKLDNLLTESVMQ